MEQPIPETEPVDIQSVNKRKGGGWLLGGLTWAVLFVLLYFASDIVAKGQALNAALPYSGWVLWGLLFLLLYILLIRPVLCFIRLKRATLHTMLKKAARDMGKKESKAIKEGGERAELYKKIQSTLASAPFDETSARELILEHNKELNEQARLIIKRYSYISGIAVVFSRSKLTDGIAMLVLQMKLVIELSKLYGYRPSTVFNTLCFGWVVANSVVSALIGEKVGETVAGAAGDAVDHLGQYVVDAVTDNGMDGEQMGSILGEASAFLGSMTRMVTKPLMEAVIAGANVYLTGRIFLRQLNGDCKKLTFKEYLKLRNEGRMELAKAYFKPGLLLNRIKNCAWNFTKNVAVKVKDGVGSGWDKLKSIFS